MLWSRPHDDKKLQFIGHLLLVWWSCVASSIRDFNHWKNLTVSATTENHWCILYHYKTLVVVLVSQLLSRFIFMFLSFFMLCPFLLYMTALMYFSCCTSDHKSSPICAISLCVTLLRETYIIRYFFKPASHLFWGQMSSTFFRHFKIYLFPLVFRHSTGSLEQWPNRSKNLLT